MGVVKLANPRRLRKAVIRTLSAALFAAAMTACSEPPDTDFGVEEAMLIDVRTWREWRVQHIAGSRQIPWDCIVIGLQALDVDTDQPLALYSQTGERAERAIVSLRNMDYYRVRNLGGLDDAQASTGRPLNRPQGAEPDEQQLAIQQACEESRQLRPMG